MKNRKILNRALVCSLILTFFIPNLPFENKTIMAVASDQDTDDIQFPAVTIKSKRDDFSRSLALSYFYTGLVWLIDEDELARDFAGGGNGFQRLIESMIKLDTKIDNYFNEYPNQTLTISFPILPKEKIPLGALVTGQVHHQKIAQIIDLFIPIFTISSAHAQSSAPFPILSFDSWVQSGMDYTDCNVTKKEYSFEVPPSWRSFFPGSDGHITFETTQTYFPRNSSMRSERNIAFLTEWRVGTGVHFLGGEIIAYGDSALSDGFRSESSSCYLGIGWGR